MLNTKHTVPTTWPVVIGHATFTEISGFPRVHLIRAAELAYQMPRGVLVQRLRAQKYCEPRNIVMALAMWLTGASYYQAAKLVHRKDHTTARNAEGRVRYLIERDRAFAGRVMQIWSDACNAAGRPPRSIIAVPVSRHVQERVSSLVPTERRNPRFTMPYGPHYYAEMNDRFRASFLNGCGGMNYSSLPRHQTISAQRQQSDASPIIIAA